MGGLAALRWSSRGSFRVAMFHEFRESDLAGLDRICAHISRHFEPIPLASMVSAIAGQTRLAANALVVTVDDGYRNFLLAQPIFRRHRIPATVYAVAGFCDRRLWLWTDQVSFAIEHTAKKSVHAVIDQQIFDLDLSSEAGSQQSRERLWEALKVCADGERLAFLGRLPALFGVEIPEDPPESRSALSWEELRALAADGVEIGCHTYSHPILSRLSDRSSLEQEIRGARELMESRLQRPVMHFCYPNGREIDIGERSRACVRESGFTSSVTCTFGLNTLQADPWRLQRLPLDASMEPDYASEVLAGLHL